MILGNGIDLLKVSRIKKIFDKYGDSFLKKIFSDHEIKENKKKFFKVNKLAKSFATKEAFVKALGTGFTKQITFKDISLKNEKNGKPYIDLSYRAQKYLKKGARIYIEGQLQTRKWTDQSGVEKYSTEVILNRFRETNYTRV